MCTCASTPGPFGRAVPTACLEDVAGAVGDKLARSLRTKGNCLRARSSDDGLNHPRAVEGDDDRGELKRLVTQRGGQRAYRRLTTTAELCYQRTLSVQSRRRRRVRDRRDCRP